MVDTGIYHVYPHLTLNTFSFLQVPGLEIKFNEKEDFEKKVVLKHNKLILEQLTYFLLVIRSGMICTSHPILFG
jgi:hypothetical protein